MAWNRPESDVSVDQLVADQSKEPKEDWNRPSFDPAIDDTDVEVARKNASLLASKQRAGEDIPLEQWMKPAHEGGALEFYQQSPVKRGFEQFKNLVANPGKIIQAGADLLGGAVEGAKKLEDDTGDPVPTLVKNLPSVAHGAITGFADLGQSAASLLGDAADTFLTPKQEITREYNERQGMMDREKEIEAEKADLGSAPAHNFGRYVLSNLLPVEAGAKALGGLAVKGAELAGDTAMKAVPIAFQSAANVGKAAGTVGKYAEKAADIVDNPVGRAAVGYAIGNVPGALIGAATGRPITRSLAGAVRGVLSETVADHANALDEILKGMPKDTASVTEYIQKAAPEYAKTLRNQIDGLGQQGLEGNALQAARSKLEDQANAFDRLSTAANKGEGSERWVGRQLRMEMGSAAHLAQNAAVPVLANYGTQDSFDPDALTKAVGATLPIVAPFTIAGGRNFNVKVEGNRLAETSKDLTYSDPELGKMAEAGYEKMPPDIQRKVDIARAMTKNARTPGGNPIEIYPMTGEDFAKHVTKSMDPENLGAKDISRGSFNPEGGKLIVNVDSWKGKDLSGVLDHTLRHETSHAIESAMDAVNQTASAKVRESLEDSFGKNPALVDQFQQRYEEALGTKLNKNQVTDEVMAELGSYITSGKPLESFNLNPTLTQIVAKATMHALDKLGVKLPTRVAKGSDYQTPLVDKAVRQYSDNLQNFVDNMNKPPKEAPPVGPASGEPAPGPNEPIRPTGPKVDDDTAAGNVLKRAMDIDTEQAKSDRKIYKQPFKYPAPMSDSVVDDIFGAANELSHQIKAGKIDLALDADKFFDDHINEKGGEVGKAFYKQLSPQEKEALVNKVFQLSSSKEPQAVFEYFTRPYTGSVDGFLDENAPNQQEKDLATLGAVPKKPLESVGPPPEQPGAPGEEAPLSGSGRNIRIQEGVGPKADVETFLANKGKLPEIADTKAFEGSGVYGKNPKAGLMQGYKRTKVKELFGEGGELTGYDVDSSPQKYLEGRAFDRNDPNEMALLNKAVADSGQPSAQYMATLKAVEEAIGAKNNITGAYDSASSAALQSPLAADRSEAQSLADLGILPRETVEKGIIPMGIRVQDKAEPIFTPDALAEARDKIEALFNNSRKKKIYASEDSTFEALQKMVDQRNAGGAVKGFTREQTKHLLGLLPEVNKTRVYVSGYSPDKVFANADNVVKAIESSNLLKDPDIKRTYEYLKSKNWESDLWDKNRNNAAGYRGDGQIFLDKRGNDMTAEIRDPNYKPVQIDDWKLQALNLIEGGASPTRAPEAFQNLKSTDRKVGDLMKETANPLQNKLKALGAKLKVVRGDQSVTGLQNIIENATETLRLDRLQGIQGYQDLNILPSSYGQRATGFLPPKLPLEGAVSELK